MEPLYQRQNYFLIQQTLKERKAALREGLRERVPNSEVGKDLFEYLVVERELLKEQLAAEHDPGTVGKIGVLKELLAIFKPE